MTTTDDTHNPGAGRAPANVHGLNVPKLLAPLNRLLDPLVRAGVANPLLFTAGFTVLEVPGRKTGQRRRVPLVCYAAGPVLLVGTVRSRSQWIRNLAAADSVHVWLWGRRWRASKAAVSERSALLILGGLAGRGAPGG